MIGSHDDFEGNKKICVSKSLVPLENRNSVIEECMGGNAAKFLAAVNFYMEYLAVGYIGGFWNYFLLSNGGFYISLISEDTFGMSNPGNDFDGELSADAASIVSCLLSLKHLAYELGNEVLSKKHLQLILFAKCHSESDLIFKMVD